MTTIRIVNLTRPWLADFLSRPLRPEDLAEWRDAGLDPQVDLEPMLAKAIDVRCVLDDSSGLPQCVCVWAVSVSEGIGTIALIGSDRPELVVPIHQEFSRDEWHRIKLLAPVLQAFPSVKNKQHLKWLEHFGFKIEGKPLVIGKGKYQRYVYTSAAASAE
jgi:hypothetical protein